MLIQWFPGHMTKALREMQAVLPLVDIILYVLDARAVKSCFNPKFDELLKDKPKVYILNKADLVPSGELKEWERYLTKSGNACIAIEGTASGSTKRIVPLVQELTKQKIEKYKAKGIKASIRGMVIGVPNSGKSTIINNFCVKKKATVGNKPGVTRGQQWVRVNELFELLDTPGTLYPKFEDKNIALNLAFIGSVKDDVVDKLELAAALINTLKTLAPSALKDRYALTDESTPEQILEKVARQRGHIVKGGEVDIEKAAVSLLDDFRKGKLGKIMLDRL